jgi:hypothetical protein
LARQLNAKAAVEASPGVNLSLGLCVNDSPMDGAKLASLFQIKAAGLPEKVENSISQAKVTIFP